MSSTMTASVSESSPRAHPATSLEDSQLITKLFHLSQKNKKLVKSNLHNAPADPSIKVRSWKMDEFKYYVVPSPFPTLARGLFTVSLKGEEEEEEKENDSESDGEDDHDLIRHRIVIRGYDKFFNIGEVPWATWASLEAHTKPPYTLSLKSNGCIIFVGALTPSKLLITSKHSLGLTPSEEELSHAKVGEKWLRKYLSDKGKTEAELASTLWENNWTAVAELCDDNFEEHVLPYPPELTGLHLHGINTCTKVFHTLSPAEVDAFADEWGFIKTLSIQVNSIKEVREFTDSVAEKKGWKGQAVEGFVVRTHVASQPTSRDAVAPYDVNSTLFFKVKFDEPYMMYRDWREVTRTLLHHYAKSGATSLDSSLISAKKMQRKETQLYVKWVIAEIERDATQFEQFNKGKGIIATRERFLKWFEGYPNDADAEVAEKRKSTDVKQWDKTVLVPVAIPGCGKTTVALALTRLFGFAHTQSDDVAVKKAAPVFLKNVANLLKNNDVVIADKNNHLKQHRSTLREAVGPATRLVALYWNTQTSDITPTAIHRICGDRVFARGENHQTLRAKTDGKEHEDVIWQFLSSSEELTPAEADEIIDMDVEEDVEQAVKRAIHALVRLLGLKHPSDEAIEDAIAFTTSYSVDAKGKRDITAKASKKTASGEPRYFGVLTEIRVQSILDPAFSSSAEADPAFYDLLKTNDRLSPRPHVTIIHSKEKAEATQELWDRCNDLHSLPIGPLLELDLGEVLWDGRVMAITVDGLHLSQSLEEKMGGMSLGSSSRSKATEFMASLSDELKDHLHITVGTRDRDISPFEAKALVQRWRKGDRKGIYSVKLEGAKAQGRLRGLWQ